jgi:hypothetical protein
MIGAILLVIIVAVFVPEALSALTELLMVTLGKMTEIIRFIEIP